ncbi:hypothetical protein ACSS6W_002690 [Trichoderma asperelloides]
MPNSSSVFVKLIASSLNTPLVIPNHTQPSFAVSHVRGNYPNRQTGKVNFAAPQKFALERAKKEILWIGTQLFLAPEHKVVCITQSNIHVRICYWVIIKQKTQKKKKRL